MKRDLAFALESQSQLAGSLGRTRSATLGAQFGGSGGVSGSKSRKRFRDSSSGEVCMSPVKFEVNGSLDQGREKKVKGSTGNFVARITRSRRFNSENSSGRLESFTAAKPSSNLVTAMCDEASVEEDLRHGNVKPTINEGSSEVAPMAVNESRHDVKSNVFARITRSRRFDSENSSGRLESVIPAKSSSNLVTAMCDEAPVKEELRHDNVKPTINKRSSEVDPMAVNESIHNVKSNVVSWITRSRRLKSENSSGRLESVTADKASSNLVTATSVEASIREDPRQGDTKLTVSKGSSDVAPMAVDVRLKDVNNDVNGNVVAWNTRSRRFKIENSSGRQESVMPDKASSNLVTTMPDEASLKEELRHVNVKSTVNEGSSEVAPMVVHKSRNSVSNDVLVKVPKGFKWSVLESRSNIGPLDCFVSVDAASKEGHGGEDEMLLNVEVNESSPVNDLATPAIKLELKMSKKVALGRIPSTVKELLATGLLEGYSVSCKRGKTELRGIIKGAGILCFCRTCKGSRVVKPGQFEVHACKSKTRCAPYYIRLENGKNLLQVLKACRMSPLDVLEETIQSTISPFPERESIICQNCQGSFLATFAEKWEQLCPSCIGLKNSEAGIPTHATNANARLSKPVSARKSLTIASACISLENKILPTVTKKSSKAFLIPKSFKNASQCVSLQKSKWKITKKDQQMHKLVFEHGGLPDGTEVGYYSRGQKLLVGYKKGMGIFCLCCNSEVSPSQFEAHAGWASRKKPYGYIYTSNGVSLHEYAVSLLKGRKHPSKENDDLCSICADGGNLLLCDGCPRAFHMECASLSSIPHGIWYCQYCQNMFQRDKFVERNANAVAAGRVSGIDPIEEITKRCIRIVKNPEDAEVIACVLCRGSDFSKSGFGPQTVIVCDQCEKEYHVGCLKEHKMADLKKLPKGKWFCCMGCRMTYSALQNLLTCGEEKIQDSLLVVIKKKHEDKVPHMVSNFDVRWRVLNGKIASRETRMLLSKAVAIFHECFDPIVDSGTGRDLIPSMVYGRSSRGQDFGGMYCAVLMVNSSIVSAGIFRLFGQEIAELPLVATSNDNQGKGYFQILFSCIEKLLASFNVKNLVLPAADQAVSIWTDKFGFERIPPEQLSNYNKTYGQMMTFKGTCMLQKVIPR